MSRSTRLNTSVRQADATATFARSSTPTLMALGDSITANGGGLYQNGQCSFQFQPVAWFMRAQILASSRFMFTGAAATAGYTIQQIKNTHLPTVLTAKPTYCVVLAGQNNLGALSAQDLADLDSIYSQLLGAGIIPVLATNPATSTSSNLLLLNAHVSKYARDRGLPLADFHAATVDPSTGLYKSNYSSDGTHPTELGAVAMARALADVMTQRVPALPLLASTNGLSGYALANPLLPGTGQPTGWGFMSGSPTYSLRAAPGIPGNTFQFARGASADVFWKSPDIAITAGHRYRFALRLSTAVKAVGGAAELRVDSSTTGTTIFTLSNTASLTEDIPRGSILAWDYIAPSGLDPNYRIQARALTAAGASVAVSQVTVIDLTALGA